MSSSAAAALPASAPARLALMQPYLFPYVGYFSLIAAVDGFVVFDTAQYIRRGWCNRNRILKPGGGWQYFTVPVARHERSDAIRAVRVAEQEDWRGQIRNQLSVYRKAPYYRQGMDLFEAVAAPHDLTIGELATRSLRETCAFIGVPFPELPFPADLQVSRVEAPGDWGREVALRYGAHAYLNAPGGREIYFPDRYAEAGLALGFVDPAPPPYPQLGQPFEPALSVLDLVMCLPPEEVRSRVLAFAVDWPGTSPRPTAP
jgi:WbqC-like protein family